MKKHSILLLLISVGTINVFADFIATELLGRPTDKSVTINALADEDLEVYFEYGTTPTIYTDKTETTLFPGDNPIETVIENLSSDNRYYYRMCHRKPGTSNFSKREEHSFHTQRSPGSTFVFTIQSDSHLRWATQGLNYPMHTDMYRTTILNIANDNPDFHIDLGDTFLGIMSQNFQKTIGFHIDQREYFDLICHSSPLFLVLGNHEQECGWELDGTSENRAVWATKARKLHYLNPAPNDFYSGDTTVNDYVGLRENYYAFEWGNALFVTLDPFWYTTTCPHSEAGSPDQGGSENGWDWTIGNDQYSWLKHTLEQSNASFKFVFSHNMTAGAGKDKLYARGGVEGAHLWEWGGYNEDGTWGFDDNRPNWDMPIHQLMAANKVSIFFHGHDHFFGKQELDSIIYQEVPTTSDNSYHNGNAVSGGYISGDIETNSGHIRVTVAPAKVTVEYIRAYRLVDQDANHVNGEVAYSYTVLGNNTDINKQTVFDNSDEFYLDRTYQSSYGSSPRIHFHVPRNGKVDMRIYNTRGREIRTLADKVFSPGSHAITWDRVDNSGNFISAGVYFCTLQAQGNVSKSLKLILK